MPRALVLAYGRDRSRKRRNTDGEGVLDDDTTTSLPTLNAHLHTKLIRWEG